MAFKREDNHKKESVPESYRKPQGSHSRSRLKKKGAMPMPE
jgi:ribosomal protein L32E